MALIILLYIVVTILLASSCARLINTREYKQQQKKLVQAVEGLKNAVAAEIKKCRIVNWLEKKLRLFCDNI